MSHRKVYSHGSIPFSWEDSPGVSKARVLNLSPSPTLTTSNSSFQDTKIPLPPCQNLQPPRRSTTAKGFGLWQEDPFLAAYKECTKNVRISNNGKQMHSENCKKSNSNITINASKIMRKSKLMIFSCKNSCEVKDDNLVRLCNNLPSIPTNRIPRK